MKRFQAWLQSWPTWLKFAVILPLSPVVVLVGVTGLLLFGLCGAAWAFVAREDIV